MNELLNKNFFRKFPTCLAHLHRHIRGLVTFYHNIKRVIITRLKRWSLNTVSTVDDFLIGTVEKSVIPPLYVAAVYFAMHALTLPRQPAG